MSRNPTPPLPLKRLTAATARTKHTWPLLAALVFLGWLALPAATVACEAGIPLGQVVEVRTTAYTHTEATHLRFGARNAVGEPLRYGKVRSAAADWSRFPLGTRFRIAGSPEVYEIDDYGSALVGKNTIDLYKPTAQSMRLWGARRVAIEVIEWGTFERSLKVLLPRARNAPHVAAMVRGIRAKTEAHREVAQAVSDALGLRAGSWIHEGQRLVPDHES